VPLISLFLYDDYATLHLHWKTSDIDIDTCELNLPWIFEQSNNHRFIVMALFCSIGLWQQQIGLYLFLLSRPRSQGKDKACNELIQLMMIKKWMSIPGTCQYCSSFPLKLRQVKNMLKSKFFLVTLHSFLPCLPGASSGVQSKLSRFK
jgi:hypothetical protein